VQKLSPIFFRIISTDYLTQNFFVMIFAGWVIYGIDAVFGGRATLFLAIFAAILTPIGLLAFFWRYRLITSTLINGTELEGRITKISGIAKDLLIYYEYNFKGQKYQYRNRVKKNTYAKTLKQGQQVNLLASEKTPQIAFIKEIYLDIYK
jgi:hypothetical protein